MPDLVAVVIPVLRGQERNLESSLKHLHSLEVPDWARVIVVCDPAESEFDCDFKCDRVTAEPKCITWGDFLLRGMTAAKSIGASHVIWLNPGTLPREGTLERLHDISRCRRSIVTAGRIVFSCQSRKSGGYMKSLCGLIPVNVSHGKIATCETVSKICACVPLEFIQLPETDTDHEPAQFWTAQDLGMILTGNGFPCLVDGESEVDVIRSRDFESESWLLSGRPVSDIWRGMRQPCSTVNTGRRIRYYMRHWGIFGLLPALAPLARLVLISVIRCLFPVTLLRRLYGRHSKAWQLQQLYEQPVSENAS